MMQRLVVVLLLLHVVATSSEWTHLEENEVSILFPAPVMRSRLERYLPPNSDGVVDGDSFRRRLNAAVVAAYDRFLATKMVAQSDPAMIVHGDLNNDFFGYQKEQYDETKATSWQDNDAAREMLEAFQAAGTAYLKRIDYVQRWKRQPQLKPEHFHVRLADHELTPLAAAHDAAPAAPADAPRCRSGRRCTRSARTTRRTCTRTPPSQECST